MGASVRFAPASVAVWQTCGGALAVGAGGLYRTVDPQVAADAHEALTRLYAAGAIAPLVSERVPMAEAPAALTRLASRRTVGKVVVLPWG